MQKVHDQFSSQFRQSDRSQSTAGTEEALEIKILYEQEIAMRAACSNRDLTFFFVTSQALATWAIANCVWHTEVGLNN